MNNPVKIIHKFKNNNRRIQYIQYIFIGSNVDDDIMNILESIKNKTFYEVYDVLSKNKLDMLSKYYGDKWYTYFFNRYHLVDQFNTIMKNTQKKKTIESKMGQEWFNLHLGSPLFKKISYSYASTYYDYLVARNKIKSTVRKADMDFRTYAVELSGGSIEEEEPENIEAEPEEIDEVTPTGEDIDDEVAEEFNIDELTKLYSMDVVETDKNIKETAKLISEATNDKSFIKKIDKIELEFNDSIDDITYDVKLEDVYSKVYVKEQYIFMDDNIKTIRNKLTVSIPLSSKFGEETKYYLNICIFGLNIIIIILLIEVC